MGEFIPGAGYYDAANGAGRADNPYEEGSSEYEKWDTGWCQFASEEATERHPWFEED